MGASQSRRKLTKQDMELLKKKTKFTDEQIRKWHQEFIMSCPKGRLTRAQFVRVYEDFFPSGDAKAFCEHAFRTFDTDGSGYVDFKEFLSAINIMSNGSPEQKLNWAFKMYDIDGSGTIEEKELIKIMQAVHDMFQATEDTINDPEEVIARAKSIFARMDKDGNKRLTFDEFMQGCMSDLELYQLLTGGGNKED